MLVDVRSHGLTGKASEHALENAGITVNKNMVPFDDQSPFVTSGIRLGTPAMTTRGFGKEEFQTVVGLIDEVLSSPPDETVLKRVRGSVSDLCRRFPLYDFVTA